MQTSNFYPTLSVSVSFYTVIFIDVGVALARSLARSVSSPDADAAVPNSPLLNILSLSFSLPLSSFSALRSDSLPDNKSDPCITPPLGCGSVGARGSYGRMKLIQEQRFICKPKRIGSHMMKMEVVSTFHTFSTREQKLCRRMMPLCFPWARMHRERGRGARSGCFWRGLITKSWKLIGCFLWLNAWRQIVTNVCDAVDRWRDACWHTENDKGLSNGYPHSAPFSCPVTKH